MRAGTSFRVEVPYKGTPVPTIKWTHNTNVVDRSLRISIETNEFGSVLNNRNSERGDSGDYVITATNKSGEASATVTVKVVDRPSPPEGPLQVKWF